MKSVPPKRWIPRTVGFTDRSDTERQVGAQGLLWTWLESVTWQHDFFWGWTLHEISERSMKKHQAHFCLNQCDEYSWFIITMNYFQHMVASFRNHKQTCILCCYVSIFADLPCLTTWIWRCSWEKKTNELGTQQKCHIKNQPQKR